MAVQTLCDRLSAVGESGRRRDALAFLAHPPDVDDDMLIYGSSRCRCCLVVPGIALLALLAGSPASRAQPRVQAADGDSLRLGGQRIRLFGIDAPELHQTCQNDKGKPYACGVLAKHQLERAIKGPGVKCQTVATDRYGRSVADCTVNGKDLSDIMVRSRRALDTTRDGVYLAAEAEARRARRGMWAGTFEEPADWRLQNPREGPPLRPRRPVR